MNFNFLFQENRKIEKIYICDLSIQAETAATQVGVTSKSVGASLAQLLTAATQGNENYTSISARNTATALRNLTAGVRGVAACTTDKQV